MVELYLSGLSTYQIADRTGIPKSTVLKRLKRMETSLRSLSDRVRSMVVCRIIGSDPLRSKILDCP